MNEASLPVYPDSPRNWLWVPALTALLSLVAYGWALWLPFVSDDYLQITLGKQYGPPRMWAALAADPLYRCRATSILLTWLTEPWAGLQPLGYNVTSLLLHVLNTWLVFSLGFWRRIGWRISAVAACVFAIGRGHQEAVVWYSALPELLVFFFVLACVLFWVLRYERPARSGLWYGLSFAAFSLALLSKESAVAAVGLLALVEIRETTRWQQSAKVLAPFAALALFYFVADFMGRGQNQHYQDGTFSLSAPFWSVLARSFVRMIWVWGALSLAALAVWRARTQLPLLATAALWMVVSLLPYCFLTYMPVVPSRHTYLAGAGLALIVAAGFTTLLGKPGIPRAVFAGIALLMLLHSTAYLWIHKQRQFQERAEPTELLVKNLRDRRGPVKVYCFPYGPQAAELAVSMRLGPDVQPIIVGTLPPAEDADGVVDLCGTALARAARR